MAQAQVTLMTQAGPVITSSKFRPYFRFRPAGNIVAAEFAKVAPKFAKRQSRSRGALAEGRRFDKLVAKALQAEHPNNYVPHPWIKYLSEGFTYFNYCQPDGLFGLGDQEDFASCSVCIVETKLTFVPDAWFKLNHLYEPLVRRVLDQGKDRDIFKLSIVRAAAPHVAGAVPGGVEVLHNLNELKGADPKKFYLLLWGQSDYAESSKRRGKT